MNRSEKEQFEAYRSEYLDLCHAMQSGVHSEILEDPSGKLAAVRPKNLRVGVNSAMADHASLVRLLVRKGIISNIEYVKALRDGMAEEVKRYERRLSKHFGKEIHLH